VLQAAGNGGHGELLRLLLAYGADATRIDPGRWVIYPELAEILLAHGANVNVPEGQWIWVSCIGNNSQRDEPTYVEALLDRGVC